MLKTLFSFILLLVPGIIWGQNMPEGRASAKFIYHPQLKALLLIDGYQLHPEGDENPVWAWQGTTWTRIEASGPGSRSLSSGDLDKKAKQVVMFGGVGKTDYDDLKKDTWAFDGKKWQEIRTNDIGSRDHHQMVYADHLNAFVLYGGSTATRDFDSTTWILKDKTFTPMMIEGPGSRYHFGMAYDPVRKKVVLFSGGNKSRKIQNDVWEFDGSAWKKIIPVQEIASRVWHSMVYNEDLKMILLHGGKSNFKSTGETWGWDGKTWTLVASDGPHVVLGALGYDPVRKVTVAFGENGEDNTMKNSVWELKQNKWTKIIEGDTWRWSDADKKYVLADKK